MSNKILPKLEVMTPYTLFRLQVKGVYDSFRNEGRNFLPPDMGGPLGQREVINSDSVLEVIDVDIE